MGFFYFRTMRNQIESIYKYFEKYRHVFTDSRQAYKGGIFFALRGESFDGNTFAVRSIRDGANLAVVDDKKIKHPQCILVDNVLDTLQKLANYHRNKLKIPIIAITGTNGKTTTKELTAAVLSEKYKVLATSGNYNNHIGVPLTLLRITAEHQLAIIEMGANHPGEIDFLCNIAQPDYGIITNVGKAHLEGFGSFEGVIKTKGELYRYIDKHGKGIFINADNGYLGQMAPANIKKYTYAQKSDKTQLLGNIAGEGLYVTAKVLFPKGWLYLKSKLIGDYNIENILAAVRIALKFDVDPIDIQCAIEKYTPENNRSQFVDKNNVSVLVDCYNANPTSMMAAINNFSIIKHKSKVYILGEMLELGDNAESEHQKIIDKISDTGNDRVFVVGKIFERMQLPSNFSHYACVDELIEKTPREFWQNKLILLKGSRGIKLEKFLDIL